MSYELPQGITIAQAVELIKVAPKEDAILLTGPPGFGKSSAVIEAAAQLKAAYWPCYVGTKEAVEMQGLPHLFDRDGKRYGDWAPFSGVFPLQGEQHSGTIIINLDDLGHAAPSVVKAAVRCVYGDGSARYMGNHRLYDDIRIVGTTNLHTHRAGAHRFETYVTNRVTQIEVSPDAREWCTWALGHGVNPAVVGFVSWKHTVTDFAPDKDAFMSPRSLAKLGRFLTNLADAGINGATLRAVAYGTIGEQAGSEFLAYHALADKLPDMEAVLAGKRVTLPHEPEVQYMFVTSFIAASKEEHTRLVVPLIEQLSDAGGSGFEVAAFLTFECLKGSAKHLRKISSESRFYTGWLSQYGKYLP